MKTLVIITHPNIEESVVNRRWLEELTKYPDKYVIHQLHKVYSDEKINVKAEQGLVEQYDKIVFQFPVFWYSCPSLLKKWIDEVLISGWAYGSKSGYKVAGKKIALAVSAGLEEYEYGPEEQYKYTMEELLRPFELTFEYVKADYKPFFAFYGIDQNASKEWIEQSVPSYLDFLESL
ncbi:NAD(P)H-dependent oxidoreductase [Dyadobacter sp. CY312]|uniref:NAD(P)H-dependent oxidoreductase n=1 Tax=Dyadobacter sp. CY312 TaxID=2907303 RepID=UPI001F46C970|nr:NAD(P)H-dependent oxidoreductase [Dyadobacter sp. CY312]MCE7043176.1 NAD(P)H-dependent oxidoreductase [Dyadobacter sp. CY312]